MTDKEKPEGMSLAEIDILTAIYTIEAKVSDIKEHQYNHHQQNLQLSCLHRQMLDRVERMRTIDKESLDALKNHLNGNKLKLFRVQAIIIALLGIVLWKIF
jgi:hypothetical protein